MLRCRFDSYPRTYVWRRAGRNINSYPLTYLWCKFGVMVLDWIITPLILGRMCWIIDAICGSGVRFPPSLHERCSSVGRAIDEKKASTMNLSGISNYDDTMTVSHYNMLPQLPRGFGISKMKLGVNYRLDESRGKPMSVVPVYKRIDDDNVSTLSYRLI